MKKVNHLYKRLFDEFQRRLGSRVPERACWHCDKGLVELDRLQPSGRLRIDYATLATARFHLQGRKRQLLSVDIQWGDSSRSASRSYARPFFEFLHAQAADIEDAVRVKTGMPGIVRLNEDTPKADWLMEAGYVHDEGLDLDDPERFEEHVAWLVAVAPVARDQWLMALNAYARDKNRP